MSASADWSMAPLSDLVAPDAPIGYGIVQPGPSVRDGVPMIAIRDLLNVTPEKLHRTARAIDANYRRSRVVPGDVLISVKGTTGRIGVVPPSLSANISRDVARLRFHRDQVPGYWMQLLRSEGAQRILDQARVGTTRQELSIGTLKTLEFSYPSTFEQRAISERLADADRSIEAIAALIAKKCDVKQGMMQDLLSGRVRLAGFSSPWVERRIADVAEIAKGVQLGRAEMTESGSVPVWNGGVVPSGFTDAPNVRRPVVTISEGGNSCGWVGRPDGEFWLGGHCYSVDPRGDGHSVAFLYHRLKAVEPSLMALRVGSGLPNIQKKRLGGFVILVPADAGEAAAVASMFDDVDADLSALERRLESARALKGGMMQELLTGRTRLPVEAT